MLGRSAERLDVVAVATPSGAASELDHDCGCGRAEVLTENIGRAAAR
jgi:hypothetical protein